jgi:hypothetical protein
MSAISIRNEQLNLLQNCRANIFQGRIFLKTSLFCKTCATKVYRNIKPHKINNVVQFQSGKIKIIFLSN